MLFEDLFKLNIQLFSADPAGGGDENPTDEEGKGKEPVKVEPTEHMIPKYRFDEVSSEVKRLREENTALAERASELEAKDARIAELENEIKEIKTGHKTERLNEAKISAVKARYGDKVKDFDLLVQLLDLDAIQLNKEGKVKGLAVQVKELQKSKAYLWKKAEPVVTPGSGKTQPGEKSFARTMAEKRVAGNKVTEKGKNYFK